jgi:hypothetical protein
VSLQPSRHARWFALALLAVPLAVPFVSARPPAERPAAAPTVAPAGPRRADPMPAEVRHVVVGGGPAPDGNQVEIERTVAAAHRALGGDTVILFAGGADTRSVQVEDGVAVEDPLLRELGEIFAPRPARDAHYRPTTLPVVHGPAELAVLEATLEEAFAASGPLDLVLVGHGAPADAPSEAAFLTWGGVPLDALGLDALLGEAPARPVRVIATHCYGGGLAELAFAGADEKAGPSAAARCGLFATTWDREAAGCDADPARRSDGWAAHFFAALAGQDPSGATLPGLDLDGDGAISGLEAHAQARAASRSIDVPTSTSLRLLRALAPASGPEAPVSLPDEEAVVRRLSEALDERAAHEADARAGELEASLGELDAAREELEAESDAAWTALSSALLSRWPVLDDPYHPDFARTLAAERAAIERFLEASGPRAELDALTARLDALAASAEGLELELALLERLLAAHETLALAARLHAAGGEDWARYERLRACEAGL